MMFIIKYWKLILTGSIAFSLGFGGGYKAGNIFGHISGVKDGKAIVEASILKESLKSATELDRIEHETQAMPDSAINDDLHSLGVMRRAEDR